MNTLILTLSCEDTHGIVAQVSTFLSAQKGFITELAQYGDPSTNQFFLRAEFRVNGETETLTQSFQPIADEYAMQFCFALKSERMRTLLLVSKQSHCLNHLLHKTQMGDLNLDIRGIVSNHETLHHMAEWYDLPFYHFPIEKGNKAKQEGQIIALAERESVELIVLARYMQILSSEFCSHFHGRSINIHHSFLPSFKGAKPYHQAYERGVKMIGATAHYVTDNLDEGPIIAQEVTHVTHAQLPQELVQVGEDNENLTLARAIKYHSERRVLIDGNKTVIF